VIGAADNALILAGNGAIRKRAAQQLRRLASKTGIGVVNTFMGKGAVSLDDPHCLYTIGMQGKDHIIAAFHKADTIITIGYDLVEYAPSFWNKGKTKQIIHIDFEPAEIDRDYPVTVDVTADIADALWHLNEGLNNRFEDRLPFFDINDHAALRETIHADLWAEENDLSFPMKPQRILTDVRKALSPGDILLSDVGAHKMWIARYYQCYEPNGCLISNGFCTMGFALPGAMGATFAHPDKRVVAICGDAGFLMNVQDLETLARYNADIVCIVWADGGYGLIEWKQSNQFDGRHSDLAFNNPDFELLAKSFGPPKTSRRRWTRHWRTKVRPSSPSRWTTKRTESSPNASAISNSHSSGMSTSSTPVRHDQGRWYAVLFLGGGENFLVKHIASCVDPD